MNPKNQPTIEKVGLIGIKGSGKTNLFADLSFALEGGLHGYPIARSLEVIPTRKTLKEAQESEHKDPATATQTLSRGIYDVHYVEFDNGPDQNNAGGSKQKKRIELMDGPGETQFPKPGSQQDPFRMQRKDQNQWLSDAKGLVITVPVFRLNDSQYFQRIVNILWPGEDEVDNSDTTQQNDDLNLQLSSVERVVIAVTMFDLLMFRFRERALEFAAMPDFVAKVLGTIISDRTLKMINRLQYPFRQSNVDLRFIATSSWGFHPDYGCANLDPNGLTPTGTEFGQRLQDIEISDISPGEYTRHPYMAADPVLFAALGLDNKFLLKQEQINLW